jgi:hypothetical protein
VHSMALVAVGSCEIAVATRMVELCLRDFFMRLDGYFAVIMVICCP